MDYMRPPYPFSDPIISPHPYIKVSKFRLLSQSNYIIHSYPPFLKSISDRKIKMTDNNFINKFLIFVRTYPEGPHRVTCFDNTIFEVCKDCDGFGVLFRTLENKNLTYDWCIRCSANGYILKENDMFCNCKQCNGTGFTISFVYDIWRYKCNSCDNTGLWTWEQKILGG